MKKLLFSLFIILSSLNVFTYDKDLDDLHKFIYYPELFSSSDKTCDNVFVQYLISKFHRRDDTKYSRRSSKALELQGIYSSLCEELKKDPYINLALIQSNELMFQYIDPRLAPNYDQLALMAVIKSPHNFRYVKPEEISRPETYDTVTRLAVIKSPHNLGYVQSEFLSSSNVYEEVWENVFYTYNRDFYTYNRELLDDIRKFRYNPKLFSWSDKTCDNVFVQYLISQFNYYDRGSWSERDDPTLLLQVIYSSLCEELKKDPYINLALIQTDQKMFEYIDPRLAPNYDQLALMAVIKSPYNFRYVKPELLSSPEVYDTVTRLAAIRSGRNFAFIKPEFLSSSNVYEEVRKVISWNISHGQF